MSDKLQNAIAIRLENKFHFNLNLQYYSIQTVISILKFKYMYMCMFSFDSLTTVIWFFTGIHAGGKLFKTKLVNAMINADL